MKRKLLFVAALVASALGFNANAKEDVTNLIQNADLSQRNQGWTCEKYTAWEIATDASHVNVMEFWAGNNYTDGKFKVSQSVTLTKGHYHLAINAFYRNGGNGDGTNDNHAWIFATNTTEGKKTQNVVALSSMTYLSGNYTGNSDLWRASNAFKKGDFKNEFDFEIEEESVDVEIGFEGKEFSGSSWCIFGPVTLYQYELSDYLSSYEEKVTEAEELYNSLMAGSVLAALKKAASKGDELQSQEINDVIEATTALEAAINAAKLSIIEFAPAAAMKASADAIAAVEYTEVSVGSHAAFEAAIKSALETSKTASELIAALQDAVRTYINAAEPKNDGESFDITCLIENPDFANNTKDGWSSDKTPGISYKCLEFYDTTFDINQTLEGLPAGSYSLSVQAFTRPGSNAEAYPAYTRGINNVHAELYVNNTASKVGNIYSYTGNTTGQKATTPEYWADYECVTDNGRYWVPNGMEGASLYFADGAYVTTVAALVEDGSLKIGFRDKEHTQGQWTMLTNFKLYYYGSSKLVYYQQYLPQLIEEVEADLSNNLYANVLGKELSDLEKALYTEPSTETEAAYQKAIDAIRKAQDTYRAAQPTYDAFIKYQETEQIDPRKANVGDGAFQIAPATEEALYAQYQALYDKLCDTEINSRTTVNSLTTIVANYEAALSNYENAPLNVPAEGARFMIVPASEDHKQNGNAVTATLGATSDNNPTGYGFSAANSPVDVNRAQAFIFTNAEDEENPNYYYISIVREEGIVYLTNGTANESAAGWAAQQIQGTTDASKKMAFEVIAPMTEEGLNIRNIEYGALIALQDGGALYTENGNNLLKLTPAEKASVTINIPAGKYATAIFPFTPSLPAGVEVYTEEEIAGDVVKMVTATTVKANVPYVLKNTTNAEVKIALTDFGTATADSYTVGDLTGVYTNATVPQGSYVLQTQNVQGFYLVNSKTFAATPYHAYLTKPTAAEAGVKALFFDGDGEATGIETVQQNVIAEDAVIYDLTGRRVQKPTTGGVYIMNGTKVILK